MIKKEKKSFLYIIVTSQDQLQTVKSEKARKWILNELAQLYKCKSKINPIAF